MIVGGYSLDLYCDNVDTNRCVKTRAVQNEFFGQSRREVMAAARKVGWSFVDNREAYCPECTKARKR